MNGFEPPSHRAFSSRALDLKQLHLAVAAADCGSFRKAAELLRLQQSSLSRSIRQIEHRLGIIIFDRSSGGASPTPAGQRILRLSRMILDEFDTLIATAKSVEANEDGRLAVGFCTSLSTGNLFAALLDFKRRLPRVELATVERSRARLAVALRSGSVDVLIVTGCVPLFDGKAMPLWAERAVVVIPEAHPLSARDTIYWTDLAGETILLSQYDAGFELENLLMSKLGFPADRPKVERHYASRVTINSLVSMKAGISLALESDVSGAASGLICRELRDGQGPSRLEYSAYWNADNQNPALAAFLSMLAERYPFGGVNSWR